MKQDFRSCPICKHKMTKKGKNLYICKACLHQLRKCKVCGEFGCTKVECKNVIM